MSVSLTPKQRCRKIERLEHMREALSWESSNLRLHPVEKMALARAADALREAIHIMEARL